MGLLTLCWTHVHPLLILFKLSQEIVGGSHPGVLDKLVWCYIGLTMCVYMHEEQSLVVVVVKSLSQISTMWESPWPSNLFVLHGIWHRTPLPSVMVTIYGRWLERDDLAVLGFGGNANCVPLIISAHILMQINTPLVLTSPPSKLRSAHIRRV